MRNYLKPLITGGSALALTTISSSATTIYLADFEGGASTGWTDGAYSDPVNNNDEPARASSVVAGFNGTSFGFLLETDMFDKTTNPSWAGTQVRTGTIAGADFDGFAPSDLTMGFKFAVTADAGPSSTIRFELREDGGITTHAVSVPVIDLVGGLNDFDFTLDQNQTAAFVTQGGFDALKTKRIYVQVQNSWAVEGSERNIDLAMDDFSIVAAVPEPSSALLGLIGTGLLLRRRR